MFLGYFSQCYMFGFKQLIMRNYQSTQYLNIVCEHVKCHIEINMVKLSSLCVKLYASLTENTFFYITTHQLFGQFIEMFPKLTRSHHL